MNEKELEGHDAVSMAIKHVKETCHIQEFTTDNRDPLTTWIWIDHGSRFVEVFPWELVQNAIENAGIEFTELEMDKIISITSDDDLQDYIAGKAWKIFEERYPEQAADIRKADETDHSPKEESWDPLNEIIGMCIGAGYFITARYAFDRAFRELVSPWRRQGGDE